MNRADALRLLTANCACQEDATFLNRLSDASLFKLARNAKAEGSNADVVGSDTTDQAGGEEDDDSDDDDMTADAESQVKGKTGGAVTGNRRKAVTVNEWLGKAPAEVREVVREGQQALHAQKLALARRLVSHVADPERRKLIGNKLMALPLDELRERVELLPPVANVNPFGPAGYSDPGAVAQSFAPPVYLGAGDPAPTGDPTANAAPADGDALPLPTVNWAQEPDPYMPPARLHKTATADARTADVL